MSTFSTLLGRIRNALDSTLTAILEDLSTGNADRDLVAKNVTVDRITHDAYYKDQIISLVGINPVGPADAPTASTTGEGWEYAGGSTDNVAVLGVQINHDCVQGAGVVIKPHIHWRKTSDADGDVVWKLEYKSAAVGGDFGAYAQVGTNQKTPISATVDNDTAARHLITSFGDLTITVGLSTMLYFKLTRVASDTVNDTYGAAAMAMSFDFHYPIDSPGSAAEYSKT